VTIKNDVIGCNAEGKYLLAKEFMEAELSLWKEEEERQN